MLEHEAGLILLLSSVVLFGVVTLGAASLARSRRSSSTREASRQRYRSEAAESFPAPPLQRRLMPNVPARGFELVRLMLRRLLRMR